MIQAKYFPLEEHMKQREKEYLDIIEKGISGRKNNLLRRHVSHSNESKKNGPPDPHPCCIDICLLDPEEYDEDYFKIFNCCHSVKACVKSCWLL